MNRLEHAFANDVDAALDRQGSRSAWPVLMITGLGIVSGLVWAHFAILDEVTHGEGRVIPSSQVQVVQPLEGGIIAEIKVKEGQRVSIGEPLIRIDDVSFSSSLGELKQKRMALSARKVRLDAESSGTEPSFADAGLEPPKTFDDLIANAAKLHQPPKVYGFVPRGARSASDIEIHRLSPRGGSPTKGLEWRSGCFG